MKKYQVLIEKDRADNNVTGFVPELRISAVGDTEEEMLANLNDIITAEEERVKTLPQYEFSFAVLNYVKGGE